MAARFISAIETLFRMTPTDAADLATDLFKRNRLVFEATVNANLEALGQPPSFRLTNGPVLKQLKKEAEKSALSIAETYNRDLAAKVDSVVETERTSGLNRATLAKRLSDWDTERATWKASQIRQTEAVRTANIATELFVRASGMETEVRYRLTPADSTHDDANDVAAREQRLLTSSELESLGLPAHPNERHSPVIAFPKATDTSALWLGG